MCEYCEKGEDNVDIGGKEIEFGVLGTKYMSAWIAGNALMFGICSNHAESYSKVRISYCPFCRRKLN